MYFSKQDKQFFYEKSLSALEPPEPFKTSYYLDLENAKIYS